MISSKTIIQKKPQKSNMSKSFLILLLPMAIIWDRSVFTKLIEGNFIYALKKTLIFFSEKNPYPLIKQFLVSVVIPHYQTFGILVLVGEIFAALVLTVSLILLLTKYKNNIFLTFILLLGLLTGTFLNIVYWFSSSWVSVSTDNLNLLMILSQSVAGIILYIQIKNILKDNH